MKEFKLKTDYLELIDELEPVEAGVLLKAIMEYARDGSVESLTQQLLNDSEAGVKILFGIIRWDIDEQEEQL